MRLTRTGLRPPRRQSSINPHYQTFPIAPPKNKGRLPSQSSSRSDGNPSRTDSKDFNHTHQHHQAASPLPIRQLIVLAVVALCEQTALNSISPYLPQMASTFPEIDGKDVGVYVGLIASSFAAAQFATNFFWGWFSDRVGRKPVIMIGTLLTAACLIAFGFCRTLAQAIIMQVLMGLVNGNQGVVSTCLGEITDRSNQSRAFVYLPALYGIGAITGPLLGGLATATLFPNYPYLSPNLLSAGILLVDFLVLAIFLEESLEGARDLPPLNERIVSLFAWAWQLMSASRPSYLRRGKKRLSWANVTRDVDAEPPLISEETASSRSSQDESPSLGFPAPSTAILGRETSLLLFSYLVFQLSNVAYNSLYPIFGQTAPPMGRNLSIEEIGLSLSFAGLVAIIFQVGLFNLLHERMGNRVTYRASIGGFVLAFFLMPWVGYKNGDGVFGSSIGKVWLWIELGFILLVKTVAAVGGLTSVLLLITNSAPNHAVLGTLNGLAQTLSAAGRALGPFFSGGLFSLAASVRPKGEALVFGVFGGIALIGLVASFGIRSPELEADGEDDESYDNEEDHEDADAGSEERLLGR